jgi:hypothetical protein
VLCSGCSGTPFPGFSANFTCVPLFYNAHTVGETMHLLFRFRHAAAAIFFVSLIVLSPPAFSVDWLPVTPEELGMKDNPLVPGGHAAILYYEHSEDDKVGSKTEYFRIKIFSEEGKKYANIETPPYISGVARVESIKARTIRPDGTIVEFNGKILDKFHSRRRGLKYRAKTFTIPDVQVGSIVEYRFSTRWDVEKYYFVFYPTFIVQHALPTLKARYKLRPIDEYRLAWVNFFLPQSMQPKESRTTHILSMEAERIPALEKEEFAPPEEELRARVEFFYFRSPMFNTLDGFWNEEVKNWTKEVEAFMGKRSVMDAEVSKITAASDLPEMKLRKIYDRVQKLRNLSYEDEKTEAETKREFDPNNNVEDVLKHGYGRREQLNRLFVALARSAGIDATLYRLTERDDSYFHKEVMNDRQLSAEVAVVNLVGKQFYLSPGVPYCPFGLLPWQTTAASGFAIGKELKIVQTPPPLSQDTTISRMAKVTLDRDGNLSGTLQVSFTGQAGLELRLRAHDEDNTARKKDIEDLVRGWLITGASIELNGVNDWESSSLPLVGEFKVSIPGFATRTGKRMLMPRTLFTGSNRNPFTKTGRLYPVHLKYAYRESDEIEVTMPEGLEADTLPAPRQNSDVHGSYSVRLESDGSTLKSTRLFEVNSLFVPLEQYNGLRTFYENMRVGDDDQAVFKLTQGS